ncbi:MAG: arsenic resistance protein, partial [Anaerolineales bacterium]|nr:arsenic resistance protein [Anaerolineales bacterium]
LIVFSFTYGLAKLLKFKYEDAAPTALIAGSNHFEVAIAVALTLSAIAPGAALATVVGVLTEVPLMLGLVWVCKKTKRWFNRKAAAQTPD